MSEDRKARLEALASRAGRSKDEDTTDARDLASDKKEKKAVKFRNYAPKDDALDIAEEPASKKLKQNDENDQIEKDQPQEKSELEKALMEAKVDAAIAKQDAAVHITAAPKKVNWDLKRDIAKKMNRLERRTQKAVVELLRLRLEQEAEREEEENDLD
mmetsp:Transcript_19567/g.28879  ORF Transcript_19567/g.28879 Transcript_19567/m.28879 type:complete len:158 (+) Transcript_19567:87-560(+)